MCISISFQSESWGGTRRKKWKCESLSCVWLCDPMVCSLPGSSVRGILLAGILQCFAISFSRGSFQPRDRTQVSCTAGRFLTSCATREALGISVLRKRNNFDHQADLGDLIQSNLFCYCLWFVFVFSFPTMKWINSETIPWEFSEVRVNWFLRAFFT